MATMLCCTIFFISIIPLTVLSCLYYYPSSSCHWFPLSTQILFSVQFPLVILYPALSILIPNRLSIVSLIPRRAIEAKNTYHIVPSIYLCWPMFFVCTTYFMSNIDHQLSLHFTFVMDWSVNFWAVSSTIDSVISVSGQPEYSGEPRIFENMLGPWESRNVFHKWDASCRSTPT